MALREREASGLVCLDLITRLLQRQRLAHPTAGLWEAADLQWWWRMPRRSDEIGQAFWLDRSEPVAAVILTDWGRCWGCDPIGAGGTAPPLRDLWARVLGRIDALALDTVEVAARDDDAAMLQLLGAAGFTTTGEEGASAWMLPARRPAVPTPPAGYRLLDRTETDRRHHFVARNGDAVAERLGQCSLYRPELDLLVEGPDGAVVSYGLFWFDPVTSVGFVEPMGTDEGHRRLGLARLVLATGLNRLADLGASRLKVNYEVDNVASRGLYLRAGFRPGSTARVYAWRRATEPPQP